MKLLVSVRSADEAEEAVQGGADIVDAKEPAAGALGPVTPEVLRAIVARAGGRPVSAALGDVTSVREAEDAVRAAVGCGPLAFVKVGFLGIPEGPGLVESLQAAVRAAAGRTRVVAVAYADRPPGAPAPESVLVAAIEAGAAGVLLDTAEKRAAPLLGHLAVGVLREWTARAHGAGLMMALAGRLAAADLRVVASVGADVIGVRGAAALGGRNGTVTAGLVRELKAALAAEAAA